MKLYTITKRGLSKVQSTSVLFETIVNDTDSHASTRIQTLIQIRTYILRVLPVFLFQTSPVVACTRARRGRPRPSPRNNLLYACARNKFVMSAIWFRPRWKVLGNFFADTRVSSGCRCVPRTNSCYYEHDVRTRKWIQRFKQRKYAVLWQAKLYVSFFFFYLCWSILTNNT